jgi:hypothetical protein
MVPLSWHRDRGILRALTEAKPCSLTPPATAEHWHDIVRRTTQTEETLMKRYLLFALVFCLLVGCGGKPAATPDAIATQVAQAQAVAATLTAAAATATDTPVALSTATPRPKDTPPPNPLSITSIMQGLGIHSPVQASISGPTLTSLQISLWPEFDRPDMLLIYRGWFPPNTELPVPVEFRIPASAGQPSAVAWIDEGGQRISQIYTSREEDEWLVISLELPTLGFQFEYYDEMPVGPSGTREYQYAFLAGCDIASLTLDFQVPRGAQDFTLGPAADSVAEADDGLTYHLVNAGLVSQGESRNWTINYRKDD